MCYFTEVHAECHITFYFSLNVHAADPPRITSHPQQLNDAVPGKPVTFTVQATGTQPLTYEWQWKPAGGGNRSRRFSGANSSILTIPRVQKSNEGSYCCTVSNHVDSQTSKPAILSVGKILASYLPLIRAQHAHTVSNARMVRQLCEMVATSNIQSKSMHAIER